LNEGNAVDYLYPLCSCIHSWRGEPGVFVPVVIHVNIISTVNDICNK